MRLSSRSPRHTNREPDLTSLINIVFLILIFFIVAGALRPFSARDLKLAKIDQQAAGRVAPGTLIVHRDGRIQLGGRDMTVNDLAATAAAELRDQDRVVIVADGRLEGKVLLEVSRAVRAAGVGSVAVMVERARQ